MGSFSVLDLFLKKLPTFLEKSCIHKNKKKELRKNIGLINSVLPYFLTYFHEIRQYDILKEKKERQFSKPTEKLPGDEKNTEQKQ